MSPRSLVVAGFLLSCTPPPAPRTDVTPPLEPTATATTAPTIAKPPEAPPKPASGTHKTLASRSNDDSWDKMLVAGSRLWVLTTVNHWTTGPMYVPAARLGTVPIGGGDLTPLMDLEGFSSLAADATSLYVAVNRNVAGASPGRIFRIPLDGKGAPVELAKNITPRLIAVDADTIWFDDKKMPKDGSKPPVASGVQTPIAIALDDTFVYFTTGKGTGAAAPAGKNGKVWRTPKKGGAATMLASGLPDEPGGLAVDATHVYVSAVTWTNAETERAGVVARVPKGGGDLEVLAKDQPAVRDTWISADHVYVRSGRPGRPGAVLRIAKSGGAPESFVTVRSFASPAAALYLR